jgi:CheY-like chemotaxis protein/predicted regulator of Ras-like GTPase activity (Roadblock/LC7/MglB family)
VKTVLIVDDEKEFLLSLTAGLEKYKRHFQVVTAENGKKALEILKSKTIELIVTDLRMPEMDGFELLTRVGLDFPAKPVIVMSAFATEENEQLLNEIGGIPLIEKPIDLRSLADLIQAKLDGTFKGGALSGVSLGNFLQLIEMEEKTCALEIITDTGQGNFYFIEGVLQDAAFGGLQGEEAAIAMLAMTNVKIIIKELTKKEIPQRISASLMSLLMESTKRVDDAQFDEDEREAGEEEAQDEELTASASGSEETSDARGQNPQKGEEQMAKMSEILERFKDVEGFEAVGVFSPNGEMAASVSNGSVKLDELGAIANDVLLRAQKATEIMGVGRGNMVHIQAPKAQVIARCLNEATDFAATAAGRAHIHMVLVLGQEGNLAMGKMKLDAVIQEIAPAFR